jgi:uncharacterized protein (DUF779 family)
MCYPAREYFVGDNDVILGEIGGIPFYIRILNMKLGNIQI